MRLAAAPCVFSARLFFCVQRLQLSVFDEGNRGYLQLPQLHRFFEAMVPTAPMLQGMEVRERGSWPFVVGCRLARPRRLACAVV